MERLAFYEVDKYCSKALKVLKPITPKLIELLKGDMTIYGVELCDAVKKDGHVKILDRVHFDRVVVMHTMTLGDRRIILSTDMKPIEIYDCLTRTATFDSNYNHVSIDLKISKSLNKYLFIIIDDNTGLVAYMIQMEDTDGNIIQYNLNDGISGLRKVSRKYRMI